MEDGGGLILAVAGGAESGELVEEERAVGDEVCRWNSVRKDVGAAARVGVIAVRGGAGSGTAAVGSDGVETSRYGALDA